jgi:hypothetical protein
MAIAYDNATVNLSIGSTTNSFNHTCSGSNLVLTVGVFCTGGDRLTGITYNGVAMTFVRKRQDTTSGEFCYIYCLANPATGSNTVLCSFSPSATSRAHAISHTGCKQTGIPDAQNDNASAGTTSLSTSVVTVADNSWTILFSRSQGTVSAGSGSTERPSAAASTSAIFDSNGAVTPAGSKSMVASISPSSETTTVMISLAPFVASVARSNFLLLGVS